MVSLDFEAMSMWILELVNWGIAILFIMLIVEIWKWATFKDATAGASTSTTPSFLGKLFENAKAKLTGGSGGTGSSGRKRKVAKDLKRILARALRRAYRFNRKVRQDVKKAHREAFNNPPDRTKISTHLEEAKKFEGSVLDIDALIADTITKVDAIISSNPTLKTKLGAINNLIKINLNNVKTRLNAYSPIMTRLLNAGNKSAFQAYLQSILDGCEKIEMEILGLEVDVKDITKHL